jgi:hypothetical protein
VEFLIKTSPMIGLIAEKSLFCGVLLQKNFTFSGELFKEKQRKGRRKSFAE